MRRLFGRFFGVRRTGREQFRKQLAALDEVAWSGDVNICTMMERARDAAGDSAVPFAVVDAMARLQSYAHGLCSQPELLDQAIAQLTMARMWTQELSSEAAQEVNHEELREERRQGKRDLAPQDATRNARADAAEDQDGQERGVGEVQRRDVRRPDGPQGSGVQEELLSSGTH